MNKLSRGATEAALTGVYWSMKGTSRLFVNQLPSRFRKRIQDALIEAGDNTQNARWLLDSLLAGGSKTGIVVADSWYGPDMGDAAKLFFKLGLPHDNQPYYGCACGSGDSDSYNENCFFPEALAQGPQNGASQRPMDNVQNRLVAITCTLLSILSYRKDGELKKCMNEATPVMLPDTSLFSVHAENGDVDVTVFVDKNKRWAVFCVRGTEFETLTDWFTSVLLKEPTEFDQNDATKGKARHRYHTLIASACGFATSLTSDGGETGRPQGEWVQGGFEFAPNGDRTIISLAKYLRDIDCKIYCTGHSLGGGQATLLGAHFAAKGIPPTAVISFGSPPIGNRKFCDWFNSNIPVSWRFVCGDEFAPMAPPLPFTAHLPFENDHKEASETLETIETTETTELVHVKGLIKIDEEENGDWKVQDHVEPLSQQEMEKQMDYLSSRFCLTKILTDHNAALTLRGLQNYKLSAKL